MPKLQDIQTHIEKLGFPRSFKKTFDAFTLLLSDEKRRGKKDAFDPKTKAVNIKVIDKYAETFWRWMNGVQNPQQKQMLEYLHRLCKQMLNADPGRHWFHNVLTKSTSRLGEMGTPLRILGATSAGVLGVASGFVDWNNQKLSFLTPAYTGLAFIGLYPGLFDSKATQFIKQTEWMQKGPYTWLQYAYNIAGKPWRDIMENLAQIGPRQIRMLKQGKITLDELKHNIAGQPKDMATRAFHSMPAEHIFTLSGLAGYAKRGEAREAMLTTVEKGLGPHNLAGWSQVTPKV